MDEFNFPFLIKSTRLALNETQGEFGKRFGVSHASVSMWETGETQAPYKILSFVLFSLKNKIRYILLSQGRIAIVDDEDYTYLNQWNWVARKHRKQWYAVRTVKKDGNNINVHMHREILKPPDGIPVDHINHNGLDNRRANLRLCTTQQNSQNKLRSDNTSGYKGVCWDKEQKKWVVHITVNKKLVHLGRFTDITMAALTYDKAAIKYFGEFASLNFPLSA